MPNYSYYYDDYETWADYVISSGQTDNGTVLTDCREMAVLPGGVAYNTVIGKYGGLTVCSGGSAINVSWTPGIGSIDCESGGYVTFAIQPTGVYLTNDDNLLAQATTMSGIQLIERDEDCYDCMYVINGGYATDITLLEESTLHVWSGGQANNITVHGAAMVFVENGGSLTNAVSDGEIDVEAGGIATNITITNDSWLDLFGIVNGLAIVDSDSPWYDPSAYYGFQTISLREGGVLTGFVRFNNIGDNLRVEQGTTLDLNLLLINPGNTSNALVDNLSLLKDSQANYTLRTNIHSQALGTYTLAWGASGFNKQISVVECDYYQTVGVLSVGATTNINGTNYTLYVSGDTLCLTIGGEAIVSDIVAPTITNIQANTTAPTNQNVTVTAVFSDNVEVASKLYRIGTNGSWQTYSNGVTVSENTTVYFKAVDTSDNVYENSYTVSNIDKILPTITNIQANTTAPTSQNVTVTAVFSDNVGVASKLYRIGTNGSWQTYSNGVTVSQNTTVYFKAVDTAGNEIQSGYAVSNITSGGTSDSYGNNHSFASAYYLGSNTSVRTANGASIASSGEQDYYSFILTQSATVTLTTSGTSGDTVMYLYNSNQSQLAYDDDSGTGNFSNISSTLGPGTYYVMVGAYRDGTIGDYSLLTNVQLTSSAGSSGSVVSGGTRVIPYGQTSSGLVISFGGSVFVSGTANNTTVNSFGSLVVYSGGEANSTTVNAGSMMVYSSGTANSTTVSGFDAFLDVSSGGVANYTTVNYGSLDVSSGGVANYTTVNCTNNNYWNYGKLSVYSGGTANSTTVNYGNIYVLSGGTANRTMVIGSAMGFAGGIHVSSGGVANSTTVVTRGGLYVYGGGIANSITVNSGGNLIVSSGGTASNVDWTPCCGDLWIEDGAYVTFVSQYSGVYYGSDDQLLSHARVMESKTLSAGAKMCVMSGGTANSTTVNYGNIYVLSGGTANRTTLINDGCLYVSSGGTANSTMVGSDGWLDVYSGGTATNIIWTPCVGDLWIEDGAYVTFASQYSGVYYGSDNVLLSHASVMNDRTVSSYCSMYVMSGGTANSTTVNSWGRMFVSSGGTANSTIVSCGYLYVSSGGTANGTVNSWGSMFVSSGGTANSTTVSSGGRMDVFSGGTANVTTVNAGSMMVYSGGKLTGQTTIANGTYVSAYSGAILDFDISNLAPGASARINNLLLLSGWEGATYTLTVSGSQTNGTYALANGASGFNKTISVMNTSGSQLGTLSVGQTTTIGGVNYTLNLTNGALSVTCGGGSVVSSGGTRVIPYGQTSSGLVVSSGGSVVVSGTANNTTVNAGGSMMVYSGGVANSTTVSSGYAGGGSMVVYSSGTANSTTVNEGSMWVYSSGVANYTTVTAWGIMFVSKGGTANSTTVSGGRLIISSGGIVNSTTVAGYLHVSCGGTANSTTVNGGSMFVDSNGMVNSTTVNSGYLIVDSGGTATNIIWTPCVGDLWIEDGAYVTFVSQYSGVYYGSDNQLLSHARGMESKTLSAGAKMCVMSGGTANSTTVSSGGSMEVFSGGTANSTTVSSGGSMEVFSGGTANSTTVNSSGSMVVSRGGTANSTTVNAGSMWVYSSGTANNTTVNGNGRMYVSSGGTANSVTVNNGAILNVSNYGSAINVVENGGVVNLDNNATVNFVSNTFSNAIITPYKDATVHSGTTAVNATINGGWITLYSGGSVTGTTINSLALWMSGGVAENTTVNSGGSAIASSGTVMNSTTVNSGGTLYISSGGTANGTVNFGGRVSVFSGGKLTGQTTISGGASVSVYTGAILDFDISNLAPGAAARINNLSMISGRTGATYTLTVSGSQTNGTYALANGASGFNKTISVMNTSGSQLGTLSVGQMTTIGGKQYVLTFSGSSLAVTIGSGDITPPTISNIQANTTAPTNQNVTVTATFSDNSGTVASRLYRIGTDGSWQTYSNGVTVSQNATVYFRAVDAAGNEFQTSYTVSNIDRTAPVISLITGSPSPSEPTNQSVTVMASFTDNVQVAGIYYSTDLNDPDSWTPYANGVTVYENKMVHFKAVDTAGNESIVYTYVVSNIDKVAPVISLIAGTPPITEPTNETVTVTASFTDDVQLAGIYHKIGDSDTWQSGSSATVDENTMVHFKAVDTAGNESIVYTYVVSNIDKTIPFVGIVLENESLTVTSSRIYSDTTVNSRGTLIVSSGGTAISTTVNHRGTLIVSSGGTANSTTVNTSGSLIVSSGGTANSTTVSSDGRMWVYISGTAYSTTVNAGGWMHVSSGGTANSTTVSSDGRMIVSSGGTANNTSVTNFGRLYVSSGGTANSATVTSGGWVYVYSGGVANSTTLDSSLINVYSGGTANGATLNDKGSVIVSSGGTANNTTVNSGSYIRVDPGGTVNSTTINSSGYVGIDSGGTANNTTVYSGGDIGIDSGGRMTGQTTLLTGASVSVYTGAILDFDISGLAPGADARINDFSLISGWTGAIYTLTVSDSQTNGTYVLANGAAGFDKTISVVNGSGTELDTLAVGSTTTIDDRNYKLSLSDGCLALTIVDSVDTTPPSISVHASITAPTNQVVVVNATFSDNVEIASKLYRVRRQILPGIYSSSDWKPFDSALTITDNNTTVYFKATDTSGNETEVSYAVTNIDTTPPAKPVVWANVTTETSQPVSVTASFSSDSTKQQYSFDGVNWETYTSDITFTRNDTVYFRGIDAAGNISDVVSYTVDNIVEATDIIGKPTFFIGDFAGNGRALLAVKNDNMVSIYRNKGIIWSELALDEGWGVAGAGDFDGDGTDDILKIHSSGLVSAEMSDGYGEFSSQVLNFKGEGWDILGTGDFNGNGLDDVLVANPTGASEVVGLLGYWESGVTWTLINGYSPEWECVSTGDFNGDGKCDMLWRNSFEGEGGLTYNAYCTWIVENPVDWRMVSVANPDEWKFLSSGDFDGNGSHDIAMINDVGVVGIWGVNDGYLNSWSILSAVNPAEWTLAGVADFNGDGTDDIAWSNTESGQVGYWQINDKELTAWQNIATLS